MDRTDKSLSSPSARGQGEFEPSAKFCGRRPGFAFKKGPRGVGYYRDPLQPLPATAEEAAEVASVQRSQAAESLDAAAPQVETRGQQHSHAAKGQGSSEASAKQRSSGAGTSGNNVVLQKANPFLKLLPKGKKLPAAAAAGGDPKRLKKEDNANKPAYLREMERYREMSCSADTKHDRPLVK